MVNRDVVEKVHERMNDELVATAPAHPDFADSEKGHSAGPGVTPSPSVNPRAEEVPAHGHWYHIAQDQSNKLHLPDFLNDSQNAADPAFKVSADHRVWSYSDANQSLPKNFYNNLLSHLLARHLCQVSVSDEPEYTDAELANVKIQYNTIFSHMTATFNYTAYDMTQDQDSINCNTTRRNVMLRVCDDARHPFWYA
jgi:hypothetical protein